MDSDMRMKGFGLVITWPNPLFITHWPSLALLDSYRKACPINLYQVV